jgi:hypothetical protein
MTQIRYSFAIAAFVVAAGHCIAATPKEIDNAIQLGAGYLKDQYKGATQKQLTGGPHGIGATALAGLALLECGTPAKDASIRAITSSVRDSSFTATQTYPISLCLLYLDKLGDPADVPLIQMLGVRLLAGQDGNGGWTYECIEAVALFEERELRSSLFTAQPGTGSKQASPGTNVGKNQAPAAGKAGITNKLLPEVEKYQGRLAAVRIRARIDDNSNTQFGVLGLWVARKHGVPVDAALDLIEKRFLNSQTSNGGWPYVGSAQGTPSMTCAGLLGLATAIGRQDDLIKPAKNSSDTKTAPAKPSNDARDSAVQKGLSALGTVIAGNGPGPGRGKGPRLLVSGSTLGDRDLYFLWSVERVGVLYGLDKIGGVDWYSVGSEELVAAQNISGSWGRGGRGAEVDTAFALLFLVKSNPVSDLSNRLQSGAKTAELRTSPGPNSNDNRTPTAGAKPELPAEPTESRRPGVIVIRPNSPVGIDPKKLAEELAGAMGLEWEKLLATTREAKGNEYTQALVLAIPRLDGDRLKYAREALAERLTQLTAETLRTMAKSDNVEQRRAAVLAMASKGDKACIPDLIAAIQDDEDIVVRAAKAGLKSLTGKDFGPADGAASSERKAAAAMWREWLKQQKK